MALAFASWPALAQVDPASVKVAFLYNFAKFVTWPSESQHGSSFALCVREGSFDQTVLAPLIGKSIQQRPIRIIEFAASLPPAECEMTFVPSVSNAREISSLIALSQAHAMLLVSDAPDFTERGGHIALIEIGGRLQFKVNAASARRSGLEMSSKLLQLAISMSD